MPYAKLGKLTGHGKTSDLIRACQRGSYKRPFRSLSLDPFSYVIEAQQLNTYIT
jgi:hypothetical protein